MFISLNADNPSLKEHWDSIDKLDLESEFRL